MGIQDGKIQYIPREQSQSHGQQQEDSFGAALLDSPPFDDTSGQEALAFIETYMMGFSDNYRDVNEPFDNLGDDLHCVLEDPCTTFDSIVVEAFIVTCNRASRLKINISTYDCDS